MAGSARCVLRAMVIVMGVGVPAIADDAIWDGGQGGSDNWSAANNWDTLAAGNANPANPPGGATNPENDAAYFAKASTNANVNQNFTIGHLEVATGGTAGSETIGAYTNTLQVQTGNTLTVSSAGTQNGNVIWQGTGTLTLAGTGAIVAHGDFSFSSGTFNNTATGVLTVHGNVSITGGTINNTGTGGLVFGGPNGTTHTWTGNGGGTTNFGVVTINANRTVELATTLIVTNLTVNGTLDLKGRTLAVRGTLTVGPGGQIIDTDAGGTGKVRFETSTGTWNDNNTAVDLTWAYPPVETAVNTNYSSTAAGFARIRSLTVQSNTFTVTAAKTLTVIGDGATSTPVVVSGGTLTVAGTLALANTSTSGTTIFPVTGAPVGGTTVNYTGLTLAGAGEVYSPAGNVTFQANANVTVGAGATLNTFATTERTLTIPATGTLNVQGTLLSGTNATVTHSIGNVNISGTGTGTLGPNAVNVTITGTGGFTSTGTFTQQAGTTTFNRGAGALPVTVTSNDTFNAVTVAGGTNLQASGHLQVTGALTFADANSSFAAQAGATSVTIGSLSLTALSTQSFTMGTSTGTLTVQGSILLSRGTITLSSGGQAVIGGNISFGTDAFTTRILTLAGTVSLAGNLDLTNINAGGTGTFTQSGLLRFNGGAPGGASNTQTVTVTASHSTFGGNVEVDLVDGTGATPDTLIVTGAGGTFTVSGTLTVTRGVMSLRRPSNVAGAVSVAANGRLENQNVAGITHTFQGAITLQPGAGFVFGGASATSLTLTFKAGQTVSVGNGASFSITGGAGVAAITMQSEVGGSQWSINAAVATDVSVTSVVLIDSNSTGVALTANNSYNATPLTNLNWIFPPKSTSWTGGGGASTNWTNAANWDPGIPNPGDTVLFNLLVATNSTMNIDFGATGIAALTLGGTGQFTGTLTLSQNLRVTGATQVNLGATLAVSTSTLTADGGLTVGGVLTAAGSAPGTAIRATDFTLTGTYTEGPRDTRVSGNLNATGIWTDNATGTVIFDGTAPVATPQEWRGSTNVGGVRVESGGAGTNVRLETATPTAASVVVAASNFLRTNGHQLTVTGLTTVNGTLVGGGGTTAVRTGGLTIAGTYDEGTGATRVSGTLTVSGAWNDDTTGVLIFDGAATTQQWAGSGTQPDGVGDVQLGGTTLVVQLTADAVARTVTGGLGNTLALNGNTITIRGGAIDPPLALNTPANLTGTGSSRVVYSRPGGSTTSLANLNYHDLQLSRSGGLGLAAFRPFDAPITTGNAFDLNVNASYVTTDAGSTQRNLTVGGPATLAGPFTAPGPVTLSFGGATTVSAAATLGAAGAVNVTFQRDLTTTAPGAITHTDGLVTIDRGADQPLAVNLAAGSQFAAVTVQGDTNLTLAGPLTVTGALTVSGTGTTFTVQTGGGNTVNAGSLVVTGANTAAFTTTDGSGALTTGALTVTQGSVTIGTGGATINGAVSFGGAGTRSLTLGGTVVLAGDLDLTGASAFSQTGTVRFTGGAPAGSSQTQTVTITATARTFGGAVEVALVDGTDEGINADRLHIVGADTWVVTGALTLTRGVLDLRRSSTVGATTITGLGRLENRTVGSLTHAFTGAVTIQNGGAFVFGDPGAPSLTLTFAVGQTVTVGQTAPATFQAVGPVGGPLTLQSGGVGQWILNAFSAASVTVSRVTLRDSNNQSAFSLTANDSFNATPLTNQNWTFPAKTTSWTGGGGVGNTNWTHAANWDPAIPNPGDMVMFDREVTTNSTLDIEFGVTGIASLTLGGTGQFTGTLTLNQDLVVTGATLVNAGATLNVGARTLTAADGLTVGGVIQAVAGAGNAIRTTNFVLSGTYTEGPRNTLVSGDLNVTGATWTDAAGLLVFDGTADAINPQRWTGTTNIGAVRVQSTGAGTNVRLESATAASSAEVVASNILRTNGNQLTVTGTTTIAGQLVGGGIAGSTALRTGGLVLSGTYTEGAGNTRVAGNLTVSGAWTNNTTGVLIFDGSAVTQDLNGGGVNVGEVQIAGDPNPTTVRLVTTDAQVVTLGATVTGNGLNLNGRTLTVTGGDVGAVPPLSLVAPADLSGTGRVILVRTAATTTSLANLNYHHLDLTRTGPGAQPAAYRPVSGAAISVAGDLNLALNTTFTTTDAGGAQQPLTVTGSSTIAGQLTAPGPVTGLSFGPVTITGSLAMGASGAVNVTFRRNVTATAGTLTHTNGTATFDFGGNGDLDLAVDAGDQLANMTVVNSTDVRLSGPLQLGGALVINGGGTTFVAQVAASSVSAASLTVQGGNTASFDLSGATGALTLTGGVLITQGNVTLGSGGATIGGSIAFGTDGTTRRLNLGGGTVRLAGDLNGAGAAGTAPVFTAPGELRFEGTTQAITLAVGVNEFNAVVVQQGAGGTLSVAGGGQTFTTTAALTVNSGSLTLQATTPASVASIVVTGGALSTGANTVTSTGLVNVTGGTLNVNDAAGILRPRGGLTVGVGGAFTNSGEVQFDSGTATWSGAGVTSFGAVRVSGGTVQSGSNLTAGALNLTSGALTVNAGHTAAFSGAAAVTGGSLGIVGVLECRGGLSATAGTVTNTTGLIRFASNDQAWSGAATFGPVQVNGVVVEAQSNLVVGAFTAQNGGALDLTTFGTPPTLLTFRGSVNLAGPGGGGRLTMTSTQTLRMDAAAGTPTFTFDRGTNVGTALGALETSLAGGGTGLTVRLLNNALEVGGTLTVAANTTVQVEAPFTVTGLTTINGAAGRLVVNAATTFNGRVNVAANGTLEVEASASFLGATGGICVDVAGTFINDVNPVTLTFLAGGDLLNVTNTGTIRVEPNSGFTDLRSSVGATQFVIEIHSSATQVFAAVRVQDSNGNSNAPAGPNATATSGIRLSNVTNWDGLDAAEFTWTGGGNDGDWSNGANYTGPSVGMVPFAGARLLFEEGPGAVYNTRPAPSNGAMPDLGEVEITSTYAPPAGNNVITFTASRTFSGRFLADSPDVSVSLAAHTLTVQGAVRVTATPVSGATGALLALEGTTQTLDLQGTLVTVPVRVGDGVAATAVTLGRALQVPALTVSEGATLTTAGFAVTITGASTIAGTLTATSTLYIAQGDFDASGPGAVTFTTGTLRLTGTGTLTTGTGDQLFNLQVLAPGSVTQGASSAIVDVDGALTVNGSLTLSSGLNVAGAVNLIGGTLVPGATSVVTLDGTGNRTLQLNGPPNQRFRRLVVATGGADVIVTGHVSLTENLVITSGRLDHLGSNAPLTVDGTTTIDGAYRGGTGAVTLTGAVAINSGGSLINAGAMGAPGGITVANGGSFSQSGTLALGASDLTADGAVALSGTTSVRSVLGAASGTLTITGAPTVTASGNWEFAGTLTPGGSTVSLTKAAAPRARVRGAFNVLSLDAAAGVEVIAGDASANLVTQSAGVLSLVEGGATARMLTLSGTGANPLQVTTLEGAVGAVRGTVRFQTANANVTVPALAYGNLTIDAQLAGTYTLGAATTLSGALSASGPATTIVTNSQPLTVAQGVTVNAGAILRPAAALDVLSIGGAGTLDLQDLALSVTLRGGGTPLSSATTTVQGVAEGSTFVYATACTVDGGITYGSVTLAATSGTYVLPAILTIRRDSTWSTLTSAGTEVRFIGTSNSTFTVNDQINLDLLRVNKTGAAGSNNVFVASSTLVARVVQRTVIVAGVLNVQCSLALRGNPTPNLIGDVGVGQDDAKLVVGASGITVVLGDTTCHTTLQVGDTSLTGITLVFRDNTTLALQDNALLQLIGPGTGAKLVIRTETPGTQSFITAPAALPSANIGVQDVEVQDNDANGVDFTIQAFSSNDNGNNENWNFVGGGNIVGFRATALGDNQGRLTRVQILFDTTADLDAATVGNAHVGFELVQVGPSGTSVASASGTSAAILNVGTPRATLEVAFGTGLGKTDTVDVQVRYTPPATNRLANVNGRPASVAFQLTPVDGAQPVLIGASFQDVDGNGATDRGVFLFSEEVGFSARRGVSVSGADPVTSSGSLGAAFMLRLRIAGVTLTDINLATGGLKPTGALMAAFIQNAVRNQADGLADPLVRPAVMNFTCEFTGGRYRLRAGVPLSYDSGTDRYDVLHTGSTVEVVAIGDASDAAVPLRLGAANGGNERAGSGDARHGLAWSAPLTAANTNLQGVAAAVKVNGEDGHQFTVTSATQALADVARAIETPLRQRSSAPQHSSNSTGFAETVVVPHLLGGGQGRLVIVSGSEGSGSSVEVEDTATAGDLGELFDTSLTGAGRRAGAANTRAFITDLTVLGVTGRNLILGRTDAHVVASGSAITVEFTNLPGDGTGAPRFLWVDDGDLGFVCDAAPVVNRATGTFTNVPGAHFLQVAGDDNGDRRLTGQTPGPAALDVTQGVPPLAVQGVDVTYQWTFVEFLDTNGVQDAAVTATTIQLAGTTTARPTFEARRPGTYRFRLVAQVRDADGDPVATVYTDADGQIVLNYEYVVGPSAPVADAGADQTVVGLSATLDGSRSVDPNLAPPAATGLVFKWTVAGTVGSFDDDTLVAPQFTAPAGTYTITLRVEKGTLSDTDTCQVTLVDPNDLLPTADAGDDQVRRIGELVTLDGSRSRDPEGQPLVYRWSFVSGPAAVTLGASGTARPTFTPAVAGAYVFELEVDDGVYASLADQVTVMVIDDLSSQPRRAPAAVARVAGARLGVFLEAAPPGGWEQAVEVLFADGRQERPRVVDLVANPADDPTPAQTQGTVRVDLFDGGLVHVARLFVAIDPGTLADPVRLLNLGGEARVLTYGVAGEAFTLDGSRSQDDGTIRTFTWTQRSGPHAFSTRSGSLVAVVPLTGTYEFELVVTDATNLSSRPSTVTIPVVPAAGTAGPPVARISTGSGATAITGDGTPWSALVCHAQANAALALSGAASRANDGAPLAAHAWTQVAGPMAILSSAATDTASITCKTPGTYRFRLTVTDSSGVTSAAEAWVVVVSPGNAPPVARIDGPASQVLVLGGGQLAMSLTGAASTGAEPLTYAWTQVEGVPLVIETSPTGAATVRIDQPGVYVFELRVTDQHGVSSAPAKVAAWAVGQGDGSLASGASASKSSGGCAVGAPAEPGGGGLLLAALALVLALARRRRGS